MTMSAYMHKCVCVYDEGEREEGREKEGERERGGGERGERALRRRKGCFKFFLEERIPRQFSRLEKFLSSQWTLFPIWVATIQSLS